LASQRRRPAHTPALVLLTDGRANPEGPELAVAEAEAAKQAGVTVFTIGLGQELDVAALRQMASRPDGYHHAPDAEQLADIYRSIAVTLPCPAGQFWPQRR
jgi:Mg-chelatase subunit ChlD